MTSQKKSSTRTPEASRPSSRTSRLPVKPEQARDLRRQVYLNKVREASDNKRWENRSDQILRQEFLARQREWEWQQATSAPQGSPSPEEEPQESEDTAMIDQIASLEEQEFQALISLMNEANDEENVDHREAESNEQTISEYGSDEEEYDRLFMDFMSQSQQPSESQTRPQDNTSTQTQDMDISME